MAISNQNQQPQPAVLLDQALVDSVIQQGVIAETQPSPLHQIPTGLQTEAQIREREDRAAVAWIGRVLRPVPNADPSQPDHPPQRPWSTDEYGGRIPGGHPPDRDIPLTNHEMNLIAEHADQITRRAIPNTDPTNIDPKTNKPRVWLVEGRPESRHTMMPDGNPYPFAHQELLPADQQPSWNELTPSERELFFKTQVMGLRDILQIDPQFRVFDYNNRQLTRAQIEELTGPPANEQYIKKPPLKQVNVRRRRAGLDPLDPFDYYSVQVQGGKALEKDRLVEEFGGDEGLLESATNSQIKALYKTDQLNVFLQQGLITPLQLKQILNS